ncbi:MAG: diaminopimelate decarboxylase [Fervidobacterium sp.]
MIQLEGRIEIIKKVASTYGTPIYIYFVEEILKRIEIVNYVFNGINVLPTFACKSNNNPRIIEIFNKHGFGVDIVSLGEYQAAKLANVDDSKIVWNGNGKSKVDMEYLKSRIKYVNIDSFEEYERWLSIEKLPDSLEFFLRINPDVDPKTHPHISTGLKENKFGIHVEDIEKILKKGKLNVVGFHLHIGSQITDVEPFKESIQRVVELSEKYGFSKINIGGGWGIRYNDKELDVEEYKKRVVPYLSSFEQVIIELGRYLIGPAGILVTKVEYVKKTPHKTFIVLDSGMNHLIRYAMYNAYHRIDVLDPLESEQSVVDVVGPLCESGDILASERILKIPVEGSYVVIQDTGAYGYSMANNYNSMPLPAEVLVSKNNEYKLIRRRENISEIFKTIV